VYQSQSHRLSRPVWSRPIKVNLISKPYYSRNKSKYFKNKEIN
jgi:hypothetical protein